MSIADPHNAAPIWSPNRYPGAATDCRYLVIHTQQGNGTARSLAGYCAQASSQVSYHDAADERELIQMVPYVDAPWAAANANTVAEHLCFGGSFAEWTTAQWLDPDKDADGRNQDLMLWRGALWVAWRAEINELPIRRVTDGTPPRSRGVCGHGDLGMWGGGHTDPGPEFPWPIFLDRAVHLSQGGAVGAAVTGEDWDTVLAEFVGRGK